MLTVSSNNPSKMARNVIDANEALCQIHIDVSQDTQEDMYGGRIMDIKVIFRAKMRRVVMIYQHRHAYCLRVAVLITAIFR